MGTIARGTKSATGTVNFGASTAAKSSEVNTDLNTIVAAINGGLDNDNIASGAAIASSKLNLASITSNIQLTGTFTGASVLTCATLTCASLTLTSAQILPVTAILDEDDMLSNTTAAIPTQQSVKAYVDNAIPALGAWVDKSADYAAQLASSDGFVVAGASASGTSGSSISIYTDTNANPSTLRTRDGTKTDGTGMGAMCPVKSGNYWKVTFGNATEIAVYWISLS